MSKGLFITGTDTDIGKTYVTALIVKTLRKSGYDAGYYKAAISGAPTVGASDAGFVNKFADINEPENMILSYLYQHAVSPHLAKTDGRKSGRASCRRESMETRDGEISLRRHGRIRRHCMPDPPR